MILMTVMVVMVIYMIGMSVALPSGVCTLQQDGGSGVTGSITFTQNDGDSRVYYKGVVTGLKDGNHGFHIHASGDISKGCASAGPHFNPYNRTHGAPSDSERHVGDLGNIAASGGVANINGVDTLIQLAGANSIIGRAVVVHADFDDLGRGGQPDSKTTGHAGARVACCVIGLLLQPNDHLMNH